MNQNVDIIQLSKSNVAITFNKRALDGLKKGHSQTVKVKQGIFKKDLTFLFMRDIEFQTRFSQFNQAEAKAKTPSRWHKLWPFGKSRFGV